MDKVLKIGDKIYAQSIQHVSKSYAQGFPQREQFLFKFIQNLDISFFKHEVLSSIEVVLEQRKKLESFLLSQSFDSLLIDNPLSLLIIPESVEIPIIFDAIDWYDEMYLKEFGVNARYYLLRYALLESLKRSDKVIAQSPTLLKALQAWGLKTEVTAVIPNGYDQELFYPYSEEKISEVKILLEKKHAISFQGKDIVIYTGKVSKWYEDLKLIARSITPDQIFLIVGDGPLIDEIPEKKNVIKCGPVPLVEVPNYTNIADALVFPVSVDCSPIAISEYLAVGKPIVMGKGRMDWLLKDGINGSLVNNSEHSWQVGIRAAVSQKKKMGQQNRRLARELSWQLLSKKFEKFIKKKI